MNVGTVDTTAKTALVAEIGNNHEGSVELAADMIERAAAAGADAVKLQTLVPDALTSRDDEARITQLRRFALSFADTERLIRDAASRGIYVFSTPLDVESARALRPLQSLFKIASGDITNTQLIREVASYGADMVLSTGASTLDEVRQAVDEIESAWSSQETTPSLAVLHCVSCYPAAAEDVNLRAIDTLRREFPTATIGYSDHSLGIDVPVASVYAGARIVEKHFTLDKQQSDFRDHQLSADPEELAQLRAVIDMADRLLGSGEKVPVEAEVGMREAIRRSLAAARPLEIGHVIREDDLMCVRPATGLPPSALESVIGRTVTSPLLRGELIAHSHLA